jgi:hypothetical protein
MIEGATATRRTRSTRPTTPTAGTVAAREVGDDDPAGGRAAGEVPTSAAVEDRARRGLSSEEEAGVAEAAEGL